MSDQEKTISVNVSGSSPLVIVEQSSGSRYKHPYRPTELQEETPSDLHKRSIAPAVSSVKENLKNMPDESAVNLHIVNERKESANKINAKSSEKHSKIITKKVSSKHHESLLEELSLASSQIQTKKDSVTPIVQPIPAAVESATTAATAVDALKQVVQKHTEDENMVTHELTEPSPEVAKQTEWSEEKEAGGLPRSESRGSRVSRVVRQLLCCGVAYHAPSEEDISTTRFSAI